MREQSDSRTTIDKIIGLQNSIVDLDIEVDELHKLKHCLHETEDSQHRLDLETSLRRFAEEFQKYHTTLNNILEEVEVMVKCQYEMRKTIKSKVYLPEVGQQGG